MPARLTARTASTSTYPDGIAFADINGTTYAIVNALNRPQPPDDRLVRPGKPHRRRRIRGSRRGRLCGHFEFTNVASAEIGGRHYALGAAPYDGKIWIIDVTNPDVLYPTAILAEPWYFPHSRGSHGIRRRPLRAGRRPTVQTKSIYLAVVNVTDPARPYIVANVTGDKDDFSASGLPHIHIGHGIRGRRLRAYPVWRW